MRRWAINAGLVAASLAVFLGVFEALLASSALDDFSIHWIPSKYKAEDRRIMRPSDARSARNPFGFNEPIAGAEKDGATRARIMVLGDSFVWGFGLPYEQGLGQKLKRRVAEAAPGVEMLPFGRPGWATFHQLRFLENQGRAYGLFEADLILVAFVVNDLDLVDDVWTNYRKKIDWNNAVVRGLRRLLPNATDFVTGHVDAGVEVLTDDHGEANWMARLWAEPNLSNYRRLLGRVKALTDAAKVPLAFALMPSSPNVDYHGPKFEAMAAMLNELGIAHVDLLPAAVEAFKGKDTGRNYRRLWANPADGHPGDAMTTVLAAGTVAYLQRAGILAKLAALSPRPPSERFASLPLCQDDRRIKIGVTGFDRYPFTDDRPMVRVQGFGFELADNALTPLGQVYLLIGDEYFPALPRMPLRAQVPGGAVVAFNGLFALDVATSRLREAALGEIVGVTQGGCVTFRPLGVPVKPKDGAPPPMGEPPLIRLGG